ncbi:substrate-binding domain-containing protein [Bradyrhizobium sp. dw_411]|uniref:substrate-binding domain-containing protein n=1 Tax=Bradyrhizobium sp. dw_411 TaxID=2720082 RepID=UPI001BCA876D|nr:substrate-binding domain-containing protein [Bradyrhizobium sp. dw_411]
MKRRLVLISAAAAFAALSAPALAQPKPVTIGVSLASDVNPFYIAMKSGIEARAKELGANVVFVTANEVVAQQVDGIQDLVARKVDGILVSPIDAVAVGAAYDAAGKAGIPVISIARHANSANESAYVSMDEKKIGGEIAAWIAQSIGGKGEIAMVAGPSGAATFRNLAEGFDTVIKTSPDIKVVYRKDVALTREMGLKQAEDILVAHPDVKAIYCANDEIALGASQAIAAAGKGSQVVVTGLNGIPPAMRAVKAGTVGLTVNLNPVAWGRLGVDTMVEYLKGNKPTGDVAVKHVLVDAKNVDQFLPPPAVK